MSSNGLSEAFACGGPVLATDCSASVREQLDDGCIDLTLPANDAKVLPPQAMARCRDEPGKSDRARAFAAGFGHVHMLREYERLIYDEASD